MIRFSVSAWSAWAPGLESDDAWRSWAEGTSAIGSVGEPSLDFVPKMLRRRAGSLARVGLSVALSCTHESIPAVFCSRHGEIHRSVKLLSALARRESLSPASFSLSVHNAVGGLFSIIQSSHQPVTAIAGGDASAGFGLVEACGWLAGGANKVLLVVYDEPLPEVYGDFRDESEHIFGWAWILTPPGPNHFTVTWERNTDEAMKVDRDMPLGLRLLRAFLSGRTDETLCTSDYLWQWRRHA